MFELLAMGRWQQHGLVAHIGKQHSLADGILGFKILVYIYECMIKSLLFLLLHVKYGEDLLNSVTRSAKTVTHFSHLYI